MSDAPLCFVCGKHVNQSQPHFAVHTEDGTTIRQKMDREEVRFHSDRSETYQDGTSKMFGVTMSTERAGGRIFTITAKEATTGKNELDATLTGKVHLVATDGL